VAHEAERGRALSLPELQVLTELVHGGRLSTGEVAALVQVGDAEARRHLSRMVERGLVQARGEGRGRTWHQSAAVYRELNKPAAYVRVHGFEPAQQEQLVLAHVDSHGRITRGEAADLCALSPAQATRLLQRLADKGELVLMGAKRGAHYQRPSHN
jgi:ATP-dependent DNA helicase RecG